MADENTNAATEVDETPAGADESPQASAPATDADKPLGESGLRALQAERDARKQAQADLAALRKEIEDASKSAEQKAADDLADAQRVAAESAAKALRYEVAAATGVPLKQAHRLVGSTKEELEADAANFLADLGPKPGTPKPDPSQGRSGDTKPKSLNEAISAHYSLT